MEQGLPTGYKALRRMRKTLEKLNGNMPANGQCATSTWWSWPTWQRFLSIQPLLVQAVSVNLAEQWQWATISLGGLAWGVGLGGLESQKVGHLWTGTTQWDPVFYQHSWCLQNGLEDIFLTMKQSPKKKENLRRCSDCYNGLSWDTWTSNLDISMAIQSFALILV